MDLTCNLRPRGARRRDHGFIRLLTATFSAFWQPAASRGLAILFFHRVRPQVDPLYPGEPDSQRFAEIMEMLAGCFHCLPLDEAMDCMAAGRSLPPRAVAITFDDGYADNYTEAMPILLEYGLTATFFIASGFLDGGCMWNDEAVELIRAYPGEELDLSSLGQGVKPCRSLEERQAAIAAVKAILKYRPPEVRRDALDRLREITGASRLPDLMLSSAQVRDMAARGMGIGGHTLSHPILACVDDARALREIGEDRERLAAITGAAPSLFAYPNGKPHRDFEARHAAMVKAAGYRAAFTTVWGVASQGIDPFQIPRFSPWDRQPLRFALRLAHNYSRRSFTLA